MTTIVYANKFNTKNFQRPIFCIISASFIFCCKPIMAENDTTKTESHTHVTWWAEFTRRRPRVQSCEVQRGRIVSLLRGRTLPHQRCCAPCSSCATLRHAASRRVCATAHICIRIKIAQLRAHDIHAHSQHQRSPIFVRGDALARSRPS